MSGAMAGEDTPRLLLVDDDEAFGRVLARALGKRGFVVTLAPDAEQARERAGKEPPDYAVVDLKMPDESGLTVVQELVEGDPEVRVVVLTGYASITTAVEAVKLGAIQYLAKPAEADDVVRALMQDEPDPNIPIAEQTLSVNRLEWEHLQRVLAECDGNISAAARRLGMHRRTLQRKLKKRPAHR